MRSRNVTLEDCFFAYPQYRGEGGNGYMYTLFGNECLLKNCTAKGGRHNFSFGEMGSTGNVLLNFHAIDGRLPCDFHMYLSRVNLIDNAVADGDYFAAVKRFTPRPMAKPHRNPYFGTPPACVISPKSVNTPVIRQRIRSFLSSPTNGARAMSSGPRAMP